MCPVTYPVSYPKPHLHDNPDSFLIRIVSGLSSVYTPHKITTTVVSLKTLQPRIDPLHVTSHFGHFCIRPFGRCHVGGQKCIGVIERKALNVSLFTNASNYSNETYMDRCMCLYLTNMVVSLE